MASLLAGRRRPSLLAASLASLLAAALLLVGAASPAQAAPDDEGGSKTLREQLESAAKGHEEAKQKLAASKKRQTQLKTTLKTAQTESAGMEQRINEIANRSYREGRITTVGLLLNASNPDSFMERASRLDAMARADSAALSSYHEAVSTAKEATAAIDREVKEQEKQVKVMAKKKEQAENALAAEGGGADSGGFVSASSAAAQAAPRNSDGSWPDESCSVNDPTSDGCITPRTLHAYQEARSDGFTRYTACWSQRSSGEHPKGRACDFSAAAGGFENVDASGGDKTYGNNLAAYFVNNADRLGVMYVIWYRQIWQPSTGWKSYSGSGGPSETHTNHVHLSML